MTTTSEIPARPAVGARDHDELLHETVQRMLVMKRVMGLAVRHALTEGLDPEQARMGEGQYHALHVLNEVGQLPAGALAERCHVADPTMSKMLNHLEAAGLIARQTDPQNRRSVQVTLTPAGRDKLTTMTARFEGGLAGVLRPLTARQLQDLLVAFNHLEILVGAADRES